MYSYSNWKSTLSPIFYAISIKSLDLSWDFSLCSHVITHHGMCIFMGSYIPTKMSYATCSFLMSVQSLLPSRYMTNLNPWLPDKNEKKWKKKQVSISWTKKPKRTKNKANKKPYPKSTEVVTEQQQQWVLMDPLLPNTTFSYFQMFPLFEAYI